MEFTRCLFLLMSMECTKNEKKENYEIESNYDYEKINSLFKNFDTMSFIDIVMNYKLC